MAEKETNIVIVPDISAVELTALAKRDLELTYLDRRYEEWDYYTNIDGQIIEGRSQRFEVLIWQPDLTPYEVITSEAVRAYSRERGYFGHVGAFTQWLRQNPNLLGYHASIPEDCVCWRDSEGDLFMPYSGFVVGFRRLDLCWVGFNWHRLWSFVTFRVIS